MALRKGTVAALMIAALVSLSSCTLIFGQSSGEGTTGCDEAECIASGGTCGNIIDQCFVECDESDGECKCPRGGDCRITILGDYAGDVDCMDATSCHVLCDASSPCNAGITVRCGDSCQVDCSGDSACRINFSLLCGIGDCGLSCAGNGDCQTANVSCFEAESCQVECDGNACDSIDIDCGNADFCALECMGAQGCEGANLDCPFAGSCQVNCNPDNMDPICSGDI